MDEVTINNISEENINFFQEDSPTILLGIILLKVKEPKKEISTFALLDEAVTTTRIDCKTPKK